MAGLVCSQVSMNAISSVSTEAASFALLQTLRSTLCIFSSMCRSNTCLADMPVTTVREQVQMHAQMLQHLTDTVPMYKVEGTYSVQ